MLAKDISYKISFSLSALLLVLFAVGLISALENGLYILLCFFTLLAMLVLLWRYNRPGIVVFSFVFQWIQVVAFVIWMNIREKPIDFLSKSAPYAMVASCLGLLLMAVTVSKGIQKLPIYSDEVFSEEAKKVSEKKVLTLYLLSTVFLSSIGFIFGNTSGFAQVLVTVSSLKWIFFMWYGYISWINKKNRIILLAIIAYEFTTGLYSYFSSFKEVIFFIIIVALTFIKKISFKQFLNFSLIAFVLLAFFITWTAIKGEYREFLNKGSRQQIVKVSQSEALSKIGEKVQHITWLDYQMSLNLALYRIQYIYHLSVTMDRIPSVMPHEDGKIWWENITFVFTPRLLFPEKSIYEATNKTNKYTGFRYAGIKKGASFSLGYFADSYVDFGYIGMYAPLIILALFVVWIYRVFYKMNNLNLFLRFAIINVCLYNFASFEADGLYLFGRTLTDFLVFYVLCRFFFPSVQKWLYKIPGKK